MSETLEKYTRYEGLGLLWVQPKYVDDPEDRRLHPGLWYGLNNRSFGNRRSRAVMAHAYDDQMQYWLDEGLIVKARGEA